MSKKTKRKNVNSETKLLAVKRHLINKEPVSKICDDLSIHPTQFYDWQKKLFSCSEVFIPTRKTNIHEKKNTVLESKLSERENVISELATELIALKKKTGVL